MKRAMTMAEREAAGHDLTIYRAIQCAGGNGEVASALGVSESLPRVWVRQRYVPEKYREDLCRLAGGIFSPEQLAGEAARVCLND